MPNILGDWIRAELLAAERRQDEQRCILKFAPLTDDQLKALWDSDEGAVDCDDIHAELNRRGHGAYCAV